MGSALACHVPPARDMTPCPSYIERMRTLIILALFGLLVLSVWFAITAWERLGGDPIPIYGYLAMAGGILFSLLLGGALMGLCLLFKPPWLRRHE